jgi:hypothetical protein
MHANKLHFYSTGAKELRQFFAEFLKAKLAELAKILTAAERNIQKYNEIVSISNSNLTKEWLDRHLAIISAQTKAAEKIREFKDLPSEPPLFASTVAKRT